MRQSVNTHHDDVACRGHAVPGATPTPSDHALFPAGLASSSWAFTEDVPAMDRPVAVTYSCFDPPPTPASFLTPSSLATPGIFHAAARVGELPYCQNDADSTPPYFIGDRRLPPEVLDRATSGVYGGISMQYRDTKPALTAGCVPGAGLCSSSDDRDCTMRSVLLAGDSLMRTPANLTPPPSVFAWRGGQTSCSSSTADHRFPPSFTNFVVDQSSCHSPVGADPAVDVCEGLHHVHATTGANTVRPLPRETRRRVADRFGVTTFARRPRTNFTSEQLRRLRQCFAECQYIDVHQRANISAALGLTETQVKVWFQNQRSKVKRLQRTGDDMTSHHSSDS